MDNCIFCKIIKEEVPVYKIYETSEVIAFLDIANDAIGHTLVIPKKHCVNILDCDQITLNSVMEAVKKISNHYVDNCGYSGVCILNANDASAGQSVFHLHFHIIPRNTNDGLDVWPKLNKREMNLEKICQQLKIK